MAELGGTDDPRVLIPGDPDVIAANAVALRQRAADAGDAGDGLRSIDTGAWTGPAAERFHEKFSDEPGRWFTAADAMQAGAGGLDDYSGTLRWAQGQAAKTVRRWNAGQFATAQARTRYEAAPQTSPFQDPGEAGRSAAQETPALAREQVRSVARVVSDILRDKGSSAPEKSSRLDEVGDFFHDTGGHIVNGVASFGNAMVHHPGSTALAAAGVGQAMISAGDG